MTETTPTVWLVTKFGVYDHGVCYVAESEADALAFCREWAPDRDEYHDWRIDEVEIGVPIATEPSRAYDDGFDVVTRRVEIPARETPPDVVERMKALHIPVPEPKPARVEIAGRDGWVLL